VALEHYALINAIDVNAYFAQCADHYASAALRDKRGSIRVGQLNWRNNAASQRTQSIWQTTSITSKAPFHSRYILRIGMTSQAALGD
jgi:hypothetical protein